MENHIKRVLQSIRDNIDQAILDPRIEVSKDEMETFRNFYSSPDTDIVEVESKIILTLDMPGIKKENISIDVDKEDITISAEREEELYEEKGTLFKEERNYMGFYRRLHLPSRVHPETAKAHYENGVLRLEIEKDLTKHSEVKID